jgi:hypothetical protein
VALRALGPRFRGDERLMDRRTLSSFVLAEAVTQGHEFGRFSEWIEL